MDGRSKARNGRARLPPGRRRERPFPGRIAVLNAVADHARDRRPDPTPYQQTPMGGDVGGADKVLFREALPADQHGDSTSRPSWRDGRPGDRRAPGSEGMQNAHSVPRGVRIEKTRVRARPGNRGHSEGSPALKLRGAKYRPAEKAANGAPLGAMLRRNGRSAPRGVRIEKTRVRAGPGNRDHSRSAALMGRGAKHRLGEKAANGAPLGAMLRENGRSVPRGARIEKTRVRARPGDRGHSGSPALKVRGAKHRRAEMAANPSSAAKARPTAAPRRTGQTKAGDW